MTITAKEAISAARGHFLGLFPDASFNIRLEEIERQGNDWAITFSMSGSTFGGGNSAWGESQRLLLSMD